MPNRIIISGGGTGGHIFPAVSIAKEFRRRDPEAQILFVGAVGGMELKVVPQYDFSIEAVWISGIQRQLTIKNVLRNLLFPVKLLVSLWQANRIYNRFHPELVVGVGGYASGPMGRVAVAKGTPLGLCEQNAFPGLVNRWLAKRASKILLGNEAATKYFDPAKVVVTGNPIRTFETLSREEAAARLGLDPARPVILSLGGSLGAMPLNEAIRDNLEAVQESGVQLLWQCGKRYYEALKAEVQEEAGIRLMPFIDDMAAAYGAADLVISRAGGSTLSELVALSKPSILVPAPQLAEDHQTKNARSLSDRGAAILMPQSEVRERLIPEALAVVKDKVRLQALSHGIEAMEKHDAAKEIVDELEKLINDSNT